ncbi:MAG TPA: tetratricopeptide repeat protein [Pyrinomonadaceae bacterium]|jgi:regulator of sirC expression with transglutaminase-like and TPR domain
MTPATKALAQDARQRFAALVAQPEGALDLTHAALLVAAEEAPGLDVEHYRARLLELGMQARVRVHERLDAPVAALNHFIFNELGFVGNQVHYYDPRNSLLSYVLDARQGIPITLSLLYIELGRRAGLEVEGVALPGHFIVRARATMTTADAAFVLVDPFNGRTMNEDDCQQHLDALYGGQVPLGAEHLAAARPRAILARLLRNLKAIYAQAHNYRRALAAAERILLVAPQEHEEHRDRGVLLAKLGRYPEAIRAIEIYLRRVPNATDAERVQTELKKMKLQQAMLN